VTITITGVRDCEGSDSVQASGIIFYDLYQNELSVRSVTNPGGENPNHEYVDNLLDKDADTKWNDLSVVHCEDTAVLKFEVQEGVMGFSFVTANDHPRRDPYAYDIRVCPHDFLCDNPLPYIEIDLPTLRKTVYPMTSFLQCEDMTHTGDKLQCHTMRVERIKHDMGRLSEIVEERKAQVEEVAQCCTEARDTVVAQSGKCAN